MPGRDMSLIDESFEMLRQRIRMGNVGGEHLRRERESPDGSQAQKAYAR
jgi:hypothetical protein